MKTLISLSKFVDHLNNITFTNSKYPNDEEYKSRVLDYEYDELLKYDLICEYNKFLQTPLNIEMFDWTITGQCVLFPGFEPKELNLKDNYNYSHVLKNKDSICVYWFDDSIHTWKQSTGLKTIADLVKYNLEYDETLIPK